MLTQEENERLTRVGRGTPMGEMFRRYWLPVALAEELPEPDGAPLRVRILGEDLVAFRDSEGNVGLVDAFCPHRRAPMFFGRNEECGLRCVYHGWKFNRDGRCVDMPSEPPESLFKTKVKIRSYPVWEGGGILWTYMGPGEHQPGPPEYELVRAPATHRHASKTFQGCNYLQALEGGLDPSHATFLHHTQIGDLSFLRSSNFNVIVPQMEYEETDYGLFYAALRDTPEGEVWVRAYHLIMPSYSIRASVESTFWRMKKRPPMVDGHIWVPIDDETTWVYNFEFSHDPAQPISRSQFIEDETYYGRGPDDMLERYRPRRTKANDYLIDRSLQKTSTFTGITGINTQDMAVQEEMGVIKDRTQEHLGTSDRLIILLRKMLLESLDFMHRCGAPRGTDPAASRNVRPVDHKVSKGRPWRELLKEELLARF